MFGDIDGGAAIFAAEREPLKNAQADDDDRSGDADRVRRRGHSDPRGRDAHQRDGNQKRVFAPEPVAEKAEQHRAQRPKPETDREPRPHQQYFERRIVAREKVLADDRDRKSTSLNSSPYCASRMPFSARNKKKKTPY